MLKSSMVNFVSWAKHPAILSRSQEAFYQALKIPGTAKAFNTFYQRCTSAQQRLMHAAFAKIFRQRQPLKHLGSWKGHFAGTPYTIPLRPAHLWLDWDTALSLSGHDIEVKQTYRYLLQHYPIRTFFDVGANYGTHSLLLSLAGVRAFAFEPNPACHAYFWHLIEQNPPLQPPTLVKKGVGETAGHYRLIYDPTETWNGRLSTTAESALTSTQEQIEVEIIALDDYIQHNGLSPDLMKIDTEGFELQVFKGAQHLLSQQHCFVLFESLRPPTPTATQDREAVFTLLTEAEYVLFGLPWQGESRHQALQKADFLSSSETNFIAIPCSVC